MNKENLQTKVDTLEVNADVLHKEFLKANVAVQAAREELANINKPKITEEQSVELAHQLCGLFNSAMSEIEPSNLDIEFSLDYNNTIVVDCINGLGDMDPPEDEIHEVIAGIFNVTIED